MKIIKPYAITQSYKKSYQEERYIQFVSIAYIRIIDKKYQKKESKIASHFSIIGSASICC